MATKTTGLWNTMWPDDPRRLEPKLPYVCEKNVFRFSRSSASGKQNFFLSWGCVLVWVFQWKISRAWYTDISLVFFAHDEFYSYLACVFFFSLALAERNCEILAWVFKSWWQTWRSKFSLHLSSIGKLRRRKDEVFQLMQENKINPDCLFIPTDVIKQTCVTRCIYPSHNVTCGNLSRNTFLRGSSVANFAKKRTVRRNSSELLSNNPNAIQFILFRLV